jgi:hypothetical protein
MTRADDNEMETTPVERPARATGSAAVLVALLDRAAKLASAAQYLTLLSKEIAAGRVDWSAEAAKVEGELARRACDLDTYLTLPLPR